jgi:uncharacterized protein (TIGR02996 family)
MPDIMAIVSRPVFEKQAGDSGVGDVVAFDRYNSENKALEPLGAGGRLFLLTVRPEKERLWLVGVLEKMSKKDGGWVAKSANAVPITDVTDVKGKIRFESGKGITAKPGALAMSLQTPRALAAGDVELLLGAAGSTAAPSAAPAAPAEDGTRARLLAAVLESPDDDAPRQVYADWLQEQGDPRGELISMQCALAANPQYPRQRRDMRQRIAVLLKEHGKAWEEPAAFAQTRIIRRGFVDEIVSSAKALLGAADALFRAEPVTVMDLSGVGKAECSKLGAAAWMLGVRKLRLRGNLGNPGATALAGSSRLVGLTSLNLGADGVGPAGATALAGARIRALRVLSLSDNGIKDDGFIALLDTPLLSRCRRLYAARAGLTGKSALALARASHLDQLSGLCLGGNNIDDAGATALCKAPQLKNLRRLELDDNFSAPVKKALTERFGKALKLGNGGEYDDEGGGDDEGGDDDE